MGVRLCPSGGVRLSGCLQFIYLPLQQFICLPVWLVASGSPDVSTSCVSPYRIAIHLFACLAGGVRLYGCLQIHLSPLMAIHLFACLAGGVRFYGCLQFICPPLWQFICLPVLLVVSGSLHVSNSFVSPYSNSSVSQSGWWCPALRMSCPIHTLCKLVGVRAIIGDWQNRKSSKRKRCAHKTLSRSMVFFLRGEFPHVCLLQSSSDVAEDEENILLWAFFWTK